MLKYAGTEVSADDALHALGAYADNHAATIHWYDYAGQDSPPPPADGIDLQDIGRLVVINARLDADDVPALLDPVAGALWSAVSHRADFRDMSADPRSDSTFSDVSALYAELRGRHGIGPTKATKVLHLKRPQLVPIVDSVAEAHYREAAAATAAAWKVKDPQYWAPIWNDARSNESALAPLQTELGNDGGTRARLAALSPLRIHDVLVWSLFR